MNRESVATLISTGYTTGALLQRIPDEKSREIRCRVMSVSQSEFFSAGQMGLRPEHKITLFYGDYDGEETVELEGLRYKVYRTFLAKHDRIELYLRKE